MPAHWRTATREVLIAELERRERENGRLRRERDQAERDRDRCRRTAKDLAVEVREYYIPDFSDSHNETIFETEFARLVDALKA